MLPDGRGLPLPKALATDAFSLQLARDEENGEAEGARGSDTSEGRLDAGETARALKVKKAGEPLIARLFTHLTGHSRCVRFYLFIYRPSLASGCGGLATRASRPRSWHTWWPLSGPSLRRDAV